MNKGWKLTRVEVFIVVCRLYPASELPLKVGEVVPVETRVFSIIVVSSASGATTTSVASSVAPVSPGIVIVILRVYMLEILSYNIGLQTNALTSK